MFPKQQVFDLELFLYFAQVYSVVHTMSECVIQFEIDNPHGEEFGMPSKSVILDENFFHLKIAKKGWKIWESVSFKLKTLENIFHQITP